MTYDDVLTEIIDGGIMGARHDYAKATHRYQLLGAVDGFEACRGKWPQELFSLLKAANERWEKARQDHAEDYFYHRCYAAEVEWVCNCLSVMIGVSIIKNFILTTYSTSFRLNCPKN